MRKNCLKLMMCCVLLMVCANAGRCAEMRQDFENRLPGQLPLEWKRYWGTQGDDLLIISSDTAASGKHSLMLDRKTGTNKSMWGAATELPRENANGHVISFCFRYEGKGNSVTPSLELRLGTSKRIMFITWKYNKLYISGVVSGVDRKVKTRLVADTRRGQWYCCELAVPVSGEGGALPQATMKMWALGNKEDIHSASVPVASVGAAASLLYFNVPQDKTGWRFYLDNFVIKPLRGKE